jgi:predicted N-acetyltransferase YhbS
MGRITAPLPLSNAHEVENFNCGNGYLNEWLKKFALINSRANAAKTFVLCEDQKVIGYYSLAMGSVDYTQATPRIKKGLAQHPIPVVILARLAVDIEYQKRRIGVSLLKDALFKVLTISDHIGTRAVIVNAKDETARNFYQKHQFTPLPSDSFKLMLLVKDIRKALLSP